MRVVTTVIRGLQFLFTAIGLGISAYLFHTVRGFPNTDLLPYAVYLFIASALGLLASIVGIATLGYHRGAVCISAASFDAFCGTAFLVAGGAGLAGSVDCSSWSQGIGPFCDIWKANTVFMFINTAICVAAVYAAARDSKHPPQPRSKV